MADENEPIDVTLIAARKRIDQARQLLKFDTGLTGTTAGEYLRELADEAERLADYVGQPDMEKVALHYALHPRPLDLEEAEEAPDLFCMSDVVDEIARIAPDVVAYVEQTGGGVATIYAAKRREGAEGGRDEDVVLWQHPDEPGWGRWPIMAGPGSFDWSGRNHEASLDDFYVGPDTELVPRIPGPPFPPPPGEYSATREDTPATLARRVVEAVRAWESGEIPHDAGVIVWPGR
jgi:hypothetical protein